MSINPNVYQLKDPKTKAILVGTHGVGGIQITVSCYNKLYDKLSYAPDNLIGMVFEESLRGEKSFAKVTSFGSHKWMSKRKNETFSTLCYEAVQLEVFKDNLSTIEAVEEHNKKFKEKK
ncbi:MAG: hypothetical protein V3U54_07895 [Thermodesulfobacteriota bacterium]